MAKSEPTKNYENAIQKSSPKPFKNFKNVANSQDFYAFFESRFQLLESQVENRQPYKFIKYQDIINIFLQEIVKTVVITPSILEEIS